MCFLTFQTDHSGNADIAALSSQMASANQRMILFILIFASNRSASCKSTPRPPPSSSLSFYFGFLFILCHENYMGRGPDYNPNTIQAHYLWAAFNTLFHEDNDHVAQVASSLGLSASTYRMNVLLFLLRSKKISNFGKIPRKWKNKIKIKIKIKNAPTLSLSLDLLI